MTSPLTLTEIALISKISVILLKRTGASGKLRHYSVKRSSVQEALQGLCYGFPYGGVVWVWNCFSFVTIGLDMNLQLAEV